jgi:hypothetical protein
MKAVETGLADNIQNDKDGTGQTNGQSGNIDAIKCLILADVTDGNPNEIFPHNLNLFVIIPDFLWYFHELCHKG